MTLKAFCIVSLPLFPHIPILLIFQRNLQTGGRGGSPADYRTKHACRKDDCERVLPLSEPLALLFHIFSFHTEVLMP